MKREINNFSIDNPIIKCTKDKQITLNGKKCIFDERMSETGIEAFKKAIKSIYRVYVEEKDNVYILCAYAKHYI